MINLIFKLMYESVNVVANTFIFNRFRYLSSIVRICNNVRKISNSETAKVKSKKQQTKPIRVFLDLTTNHQDTQKSESEIRSFLSLHKNTKALRVLKYRSIKKLKQTKFQKSSRISEYRST